MRSFIAAMLVAVFTTVVAAPPAVQAATTPEEELILLKKKKNLEHEKQKQAEEAKKQKSLTVASAADRKCTGLVQCLFGTKRGLRAKRDGNAQNASFAGTTSVFAKKTRRTINWEETKYAPGSIIIRTPERALYYVLGDGKAIRYSVGVGREGMQWSGQNVISRKAEWPTWTPPKTMIAREAARGNIIPAFMEGGPNNPLGARALYIGNTMYRVHGTNNEASIGGAVSSGCIRMMNADVIDLYERVKIGTPIYVYQ